MKLRKFSGKFLILSVGFLVVGLVGLLVLGKIKNESVSAAWFDDNFGFRNSYSFTENTTADSDKKIKLDIDTQTLISNGKMASDCSDSRFTDPSGKVLEYYLDSAGGACDTNSTDYYVLLPKVLVGENIIFHYYGNVVVAGTEGAQFSQSTYSPDSGPTIGTEEKSPGPILFYRFDDGSGTVARDSTVSNGTNGTLSGTTIPNWQSEDLCVSGKCLYFNGVTSNVSSGATFSNVQTISLWVKSASASASIVKLASGVDIKATNGVLGTDGITAPKIYLNGNLVSGTTGSPFAGNVWNHIVVTTASAFSANAVTVGMMQTGVLNGFIDEVKFYEYARSAAQVKMDYLNSGINKGAGQVFRSGQSGIGVLSSGLIGYWKFEDASGNAVDSSGLATTLTNNNSVTYNGGKFGFGASFNGSNKYFSTTTALSSLQAVSFWAKPSSSTDNFLNLSSGKYVSASSGVLSATGFSQPTIYVNGEKTTTISSGVWQFVTISDSAGMTADAIEIGRANGSYAGNGTMIDELRFYNRSLSSGEVASLFNFAPGPVAYWKMEEGSGTTITDSQNGITSQAFSGDTAFSAGKFGKGLSFDGTDDVVRITETTPLDFGATTDSFTYMGYFKTSYNSSGSQAIVYKDDGVTNVGVQLRITGSELPLFRIHDGTNSNSITGSTNMADGKWHHYAGVRDANADTISLYVDGILIATQTDTTTATVANNDDVSIGNGDASYSGADANGQIDEVKIYNYARSEKEIIEDMNGGHPAPGSPVGSPLGFWKFDLGNGTIANDSGSSPNRGTLTNMASPASVGISGWNPSGKLNKAVSFDGTNDFVDLGDLSYSEGVQKLSWSMWVNPNTLSTSDCFFCKLQATPASSKSSFGIGTGNSNASAVLVFISTDGNTNYATAETPAGVLSVGQWTHVLAVFDGTQTGDKNRLKIYINGVLQNVTIGGTAGVPSSTQATTSNARLGASSDATPNWLFSGSIDEVKIFAGALSPEQVKMEVNLGQGVNFGTFGLSADGKMASNSAGATLCVPGDTASCAPPVAEWKFEEGAGTTALDTSGNGLDGTWSGTGEKYGPGKVGKAGQFNGSDAVVTITDPGSNSPLDFNSSFSISAWVRKTASVPAGEFRDVIFKGASAVYGIDINGDEKPEFNGLTVDYAIPNNQWVFMTAVYNNATGKNYFYIDGRLEGSGNGSAPGVSDEDLWIGAWNSDEYLSGQIDQVRLWNYARTPAQVAWEFNNGGPVLHYKADECQGKTLNNSGSFGPVANGAVTIGGSGTTSAGSCTTSGTTAWYNGRVGKFNYSLALDGTDDYVLNSEAELFGQTGDNFVTGSWGGWFYPNNFSATGMVVYKNSEVAAYFDTSGVPHCVVGSTVADSVQAVSASSWVHFLCTADGSFLRLYLNGKLAGKKAYSGAVTLVGFPMAFGRDNDAGNSYFNGKIDEIKVWNFALTDFLVKKEFNQGAGVRFGPESGVPQ